MHLDLMRDPSPSFPNIENKKEIKSLRIWHCKYRSMKEIAQLPNLETLVIGGFPDNSFNALENLNNLHFLSILHLPHISNLDSISNLQQLESLSLATLPTWDSAGKCIIVESLKPISSINSLKHLELFGVCTADKSLSALEGCHNLESARFSQYPKSEVESFYLKTKAKNQFNPKPVFI